MKQARFIITVLILILPSYGNALSVSKAGKVAIVTPISIVEVQQLDFGMVTPPATGGQNIRVRRDGTYASTTGTLGNFQKAGHIKVVGTPGQQFSVTGTSSSTIPGVNFTTLLYPEAVQNLPLNGVNKGQRVVTIGGVIRVFSTAVPGNYDSGELSYNLEINYQ